MASINLRSALLGPSSGKSLVLLLVALVLLVSQTLVFLYQGKSILEDEADQEKAGVILLRCREIMTDLQEAETGQRGYLLTGMDTYLEPYHRGVAGIGKHMQMARQLLASDSEAISQLNQLQNQIDKKLPELTETIALRRSGKPETALAVVRGGVGKAAMDASQAILGKVIEKRQHPGYLAERSRCRHV